MGKIDTRKNGVLGDSDSETIETIERAWLEDNMAGDEAAE